MKASYSFHAIDKPRYQLMFIGVSCSLFIILGSFGEIIASTIFTQNRMPYNTITPITYSAICLIVLTLLFAKKIAFLYADEQWTISFDHKEIEISSNRRSKKIFALSQLKKVIYSKSTTTLYKSSEISFQFKNKIIPYRIGVHQHLFSNSTQQTSYQCFNQFLEAFNQQILQTQFKQITSKWFTLPPTFVQK